MRLRKNDEARREVIEVDRTSAYAFLKLIDRIKGIARDSKDPVEIVVRIN